MLNSISRLGETRPEQEWSNGTEFSGYSDFPEKRVHSKRIPKFSKTFPGIFTVPFRFGPEISVFLVEWKAPRRDEPFHLNSPRNYRKFHSNGKRSNLRPASLTYQNRKTVER